MKGFLLFVEGGNTPKVVHADELTALGIARDLAIKCSGKEVMILRMVKRIKQDGDGEVISLGSHSPLITTDMLQLNKKRNTRPILRLKKRGG